MYILSVSLSLSAIRSVISAECLLKSKLMQEILNKFEDAVHVVPDYLISTGLLMIISSLAVFASFDDSFNDLFKQLHICTIMHSFVVRYVEFLNDIQISFPFRCILYIKGAKNKEIEYMIKNTNALNAMLKEFVFGINKKCVNDVFNYYPDAWDRLICINILCDVEEYRLWFIRNDIVYYLKKSLMLPQRTDVETARLYKYVCMILVKITADPSNFDYFYKYFNLKRLIYYDHGDKNKVFWYKLEYIRLNCMDNIDCTEASEFARRVTDNVHNFYYQLFKSNTVIHDDIIAGIVTYLW